MHKKDICTIIGYMWGSRTGPRLMSGETVIKLCWRYTRCCEPRNSSDWKATGHTQEMHRGHPSRRLDVHWQHTTSTVLDVHLQIIAVELQFIITQGIAMNIVGLDIGHSSLKLAYGNSENGIKLPFVPRVRLLRILLAAASAVNQDDLLHIQVGNEPFIAGVFQTMQKWGAP